MLNPAGEIGNIVKSAGRTFILDAMSSLGGIPMDAADLGVDYIVSSANKCIQGIPGFGFVIVRKALLKNTRGHARSLSLDLYDQWRTMERGGGKWRFTSPTHAVRAFHLALRELEAEGGAPARYDRCRNNQELLVNDMTRVGFSPLLPAGLQSPIITAFLSPDAPGYDFNRFYKELKRRGYVIHPGKATDRETFRIGNIGDVHTEDIHNLVDAVGDSIFWV